jgi:hypothetical protein
MYEEARINGVQLQHQLKAVLSARQDLHELREAVTV